MTLPTSDFCLGTAESGVVAIGNIELESGDHLQDVDVAWQSSGPPASEKPTVLLLHGYTNSHEFWSRDPAVDMTRGWGNLLVGPCKAVDTNRYRVLSLNHLGSCYGSTGPNSINNATGRVHGADFPQITMVDQARVVMSALDRLGVKALKAVLGYSYGGYLAFQLAVEAAVPCDRYAVFASAPQGRGSAGDLAILQTLAKAPSRSAMYDRRLATLESYGLSPIDPDVKKAAHDWSVTHDATSLLRLREAAMSFDVSNEVAKLDHPFLLLRVKDDNLFPALPRDALERRHLPVDTRMITMTSGGHLGPMKKPDAYAANLAAFLAL